MPTRLRWQNLRDRRERVREQPVCERGEMRERRGDLHVHMPARFSRRQLRDQHRRLRVLAVPERG